MLVSDNRYIVYEALYRNDEGSIYVMDNNGNNHRKLTDNTWKESHPTWSPDGKK
jgi:Tol biopolymer transport system component